MPRLRDRLDEYPDDVDRADLGERIRHARKAKHRTQLQMAIILDVTPSAYSGWERGEHRPHPREMALLIEFTGFSEGWFLGKDGSIGPDGSEPPDAAT